MTGEAAGDLVRRIAGKRPGNTAIPGAESALTAILGRMAMELRRESAWDEMMRL